MAGAEETIDGTNNRVGNAKARQAATEVGSEQRRLRRTWRFWLERRANPLCPILHPTQQKRLVSRHKTFVIFYCGALCGAQGTS